MASIKIERAASLKQKPDENNLGFGQHFTDHMFIMNYKDGEGWYDPRIVPYAPIELYPSAMCFHYAQEIFEGLKAYKGQDGKIRLFRPEENFKRLNRSNARIAIPQIDEELALEGLKQLISIDKDWVPSADGASLYIRPFIIATEEMLGVKAASEYLYMVILSPSGAYYKTGLNPVKIYVEEEYVRAVKGGTGMAKTGGNYAASLIAQEKAQSEGYEQVLWLDGVERKYIEEVGAMNVFFRIGDDIVTPSLAGSILPGITRMSTIELLKSWGLNVVEKKISIDDIVKAHQDGKLIEAFGTGTAAVVSPIGELKYKDTVMPLNDGKIGELSQKLYDELTGIQWGEREDKHNWTIEI